MALQIAEREEGSIFWVRVSPRSNQDKIAGPYGDALKIRLTAPPVDGKANRALREFLADRLDVAPSAVEILTGHTSRQKRVLVRGAPASAVRALLDTES